MHNSDHTHITDTDLLERYATDGDNKWVGMLMQRYTLLLYGVCMKYLKDEEGAKDAVQQIFLKAMPELKKYKVTYFKSWIYMIAKNYCLMALRDKNRVTVPVNENVPAPESDLAELQQKEITILVLNEAMTELSEEQQQTIELFYLQKKSYLQITEITGYTLLQVKSFIQNGKRNLKNLIEKKLNRKA